MFPSRLSRAPAKRVEEGYHGHPQIILNLHHLIMIRHRKLRTPFIPLQ
jgi:hypothetical protein